MQHPQVEDSMLFGTVQALHRNKHHQEDSDQEDETPRYKNPVLRTPRKGERGQTKACNQDAKHRRIPASISDPPKLLQSLNRPTKKKRKRSSQSPSASPESPPYRKTRRFSPRTSKIALFTLDTTLTLPETVSHSHSTHSPQSKSHHPKTKKQKVQGPAPFDHSETERWFELGWSRTTEMPKFFDEMVFCSAMISPLMTTAFPHICCRPFMLEWNISDREPPLEFHGAEENTITIYRVTYMCRGNCDDVPEEWEDTDNSDSGINNNKSKQPIVKVEHKKRGRNRKKCANEVRLHVEVYSNDLSKAWVYQYSSHNEAHDSNLDMSQFLRQTILMYASIANMTAGRIKRQIPHDLERFNIPKYRHPTSKQINNMVANVRRRERLINDPLLAIGIFAEHNPDKIFRNGLSLDSSYRNKNENRAPVTFLVTVDKNERMLPGPVFVSGDVREYTLTLFLREVRSLVEDMARHIVEDPSCIDQAHHPHHEQLIREARAVLDEGGWSPLFFMIDKSYAENGAILSVWPNMVIRLCQFHVIQAILRWQTENGAPEPGRPRLKRTAKYLLLCCRAVPNPGCGFYLILGQASLYKKPGHYTIHIWTIFPSLGFTPAKTVQLNYRVLFEKYYCTWCQRARDEKSWENELQIFIERLKHIVPASSFSNVLNYFKTNWFSETWRDLWTDIGLPRGHNRDRISTNNFTERAFKKFDEIFLENRANKSAYRLVLIIANEWFDYFARWQPSHPKKKDEVYYQTALQGHRLWNSGRAIIDGSVDKEGRRVFQVLSEI
ncbi:hypothetical protein K435DRAFT_803208 [Dendrothele bispora CBS 962.96]|uniref:MULE transposase domain-containing protein n=1 Tax=Dendrothele bispora (strain CBS 962.96) TaxID=1314807 RepID=A0A4S8LJ20_DENBC|nr:hypothetical protein K435DRAFT_803208 [Dendrothele bispora CBS 962.96]